MYTEDLDLELTKISLAVFLSEDGQKNLDDSMFRIRSTGAEITEAMGHLGMVTCLADKNEIVKIQSLVGSVVKSIELTLLM